MPYDETTHNDDRAGGTGSPKYEYQTVKTLRGREDQMVAKMASKGWDLHLQQRGVARSELTFRRAKVASPLARAFGRAYWAFRSLKPRTQVRVLGGVAAGVVLLIVIGGVSGLQNSDPDPAPLAESSALPSAGPSSPGPPSTPTPSPTSASLSQETYAYDGPSYKVVIRDENVGPANLTQYWVYTTELDAGAPNFHELAKQLLTDVARQEGSPKVAIEIVSDREIAEAEAISTSAAFVEEHGDEYAIQKIPKKEVGGWLASYQGGLDDNSEPSDATDAFQVIWLPYGNTDLETWQPTMAQ